jgi:hypothetical protein
LEPIITPKLTFYGGVNEIGVKNLLQDKQARMLLDFGQSFVFALTILPVILRQFS